MISVVVPTFNEAENLPVLLMKIEENLKEYEHEIIVVDDSSQDGTAEVAARLTDQYPVRVLVRKNERGLASAILYGFQHARGNILAVIDADLQHPPRYMPCFIGAIKEGYDIVLGSRYIDGGRIEGWSKTRGLISKGAILLSKPLVRDVKDPISGYLFVRRSVIEGVKLNPTGYKLSLEILVKGRYNSVKELPYTFKSRERGESKLRPREMLRYVALLVHLYAFKTKSFVKSTLLAYKK